MPAVNVQTEALRVLIVDDNADAGDSLAMFLRFQGFDVGLACDGGEACTATRHLPPDALLMDIGLPGLNGWEVARQPWGLCPVRPLTIAVTGYGTPADRQRSRDEGFDFHLLKPVEPEELAAVLREHGRALLISKAAQNPVEQGQAPTQAIPFGLSPGNVRHKAGEYCRFPAGAPGRQFTSGTAASSASMQM